MTATSKQERKYGKKGEDNEILMETVKDKSVQVLVELSYIIKFKNRKEADSYIELAQKEASDKGHPLISFQFI